jgi:hypothetical protein
VFSGLVFDRLPPEVALQWDVLIPWTESIPSDLLPRAAAAFGLPSIALTVWLLLRGLASSAGERMGRRVFPEWFLSERTGVKGVVRFDPTFDLVLACLVAGILMGHVVMVGTALGWPAWTARVFTALVGLEMGIVGSSLPRTRPNWILGRRTEAPAGRAQGVLDTVELSSCRHLHSQQPLQRKPSRITAAAREWPKQLEGPVRIERGKVQFGQSKGLGGVQPILPRSIEQGRRDVSLLR